jgi:hypothetical protein
MVFDRLSTGHFRGFETSVDNLSKTCSFHKNFDKLAGLSKGNRNSIDTHRLIKSTVISVLSTSYRQVIDRLLPLLLKEIWKY